MRCNDCPVCSFQIIEIHHIFEKLMAERAGQAQPYLTIAEAGFVVEDYTSRQKVCLIDEFRRCAMNGEYVSEQEAKALKEKQHLTFTEYLRLQMYEMQVFKWLTSEAAGYDRGETALHEWIQTHAASFRLAYRGRVIKTHTTV